MNAPVAPAENRPRSSSPLITAGLSADIATRALVAACDVTLIIDRDGIVRDVAIGNEELRELGIENWQDRPWLDSVLPENRSKISEMLAGGGEPGRWRQVNHSAASGDFPIRYLAIPNGDGTVVAIGRDMRAAAIFQQRLLRAQQSIERDSLRLRQLEMRYRLLFDSAPEAIMVIDATTRQIVEANPAARRLTGLGAGSVEGKGFAAIVHPDDRDVAVAMLSAVAAAEQRHPGILRLSDGQSARIAATLFRQDRGVYLLLRLQAFESGEASDRPLVEVLERMPDAFVLTDADMRILAGNAAFLDLVQQPRSSDVSGEPLQRFIGRPAIDMGLLRSQLGEHGMVRNFATVVRFADGRESAVEVSAVTSDEGGEIRHGFSIRDTSQRALAPVDDQQTPRSVEQLTELVGRVSLKEIVRESTDLIERLCIEAALTYTSDNRASAAEILGLSRQSLYSKLHRHGLGNLSDND